MASIQPAALDYLPYRWLLIARGEANAVDAVVRFAKGTTPGWQTTIALTWIERIMDGHFDLIANHLWLLYKRLTSLHSADAILGEVRGSYPRIVDGLNAAVDHGAVKIHQLDQWAPLQYLGHSAPSVHAPWLMEAGLRSRLCVSGRFLSRTVLGIAWTTRKGRRAPGG